MKTSAILLSTLFVSALSARGATTLESGEFFVDLRESPRVSAGTETLTYSTRWAGADALAGCTRKARLAVAGYEGEEALEDVPVLVRLSTAIQGFDYNDFAAPATGADLVFCDEAETTVYPHEIDEWNTNGESLVWVRLPALAAGTAFKMGYGGTPATAADVAAAAHTVWSDYAGVWHMNEDSGTAFDSTGHGFDAQPEAGTNALSDISQMVACENGAVGRARVNATQLVTGGNHLAIPNYDSCRLGDTFVVSGWFHADVEEQYCPKMFYRGWFGNRGGWGCDFHAVVSRVNILGGGGNGSPSVYISRACLHSSPAAAWTWICIAYHGTSASLYQDGVLVTNGTIVAASDNGSAFGIGGVPGGVGTDSHGFVGQYDEIRLRGGTLSADRVRADYDIVANHGFVTCGTVESIAGSGLEIRLGGEVFAGDLAGEGTAPWTPAAPGLYEFEHVSLVDGAPVATESASFVVPGTASEDLSILADGDLTEGVTVRLGGAADGWTLHYTTNGSTPTAESPAYTGPFALAESATVKVLAVSDAHGWTSGVAEQRFDLAPPLAVTGARARQRYPWNGLVDVDFTLEGDTSRRYRVSLEATDLAGGTNLALRTVWEDGGSVTNAALDVAPGLHRFVWNADADLPAGFVADQVAIDVRAESIHDTALYMVVDLSDGPDAAHYPVSYLPDVPEGGWTDEYKTDKLVLRRVEPGWFTMGSPEDELGRYVGRENLRDVSLTKPLMAAVFETTQRQFELVAGTNCAHFVGANKPVDNVPLALVRGDGVEFDWPTVPQALSDSFVGRLSRRSGLRSLDLPTEAQWEYVCRAGTRSALNNGGEGDSEYAKLGLFNAQATSSNDGYATVGEYMPNAWDVYDMHGNVYERCLDWFEDSPTGNTDPVGPVTGEARVKKGGSWYAGYRWGRSAYRDPTIYGYNAGIGVYWYDVGFRLFLHDAPAVIEAPIVAPEGLTATTDRTGDVLLSWEPVAGAYAYQIRRSKTGAFEDGTWLNTVTNTTYVDWTAEAFADYAYWVRAQFESGKVGQWSEAAAGMRIDDSPYTVKFDKNASAVTGTMADQTMARNASAELRANAFVRAGYKFTGWATNASGTKVYDDKQTVKNITTGSTITLYAVWETLTAQNALYMVIDLSGGANASSYPVTYLSAVPSGGWTDEYKTTKLVLRRCEAGTFTMGSPTSESGRESNETQHKVTLSKAFYIGIFEVTQKQYSLVMGSNPSHYKGDKKPVNGVSWNMLRGSSSTYNWPSVSTVSSGSFFGKVRSRIGSPRFDLPTESQWESACRAGTTTRYNNGSNASDGWKGLCSGFASSSGPSNAGSYKANNWGLYDMHGNVWEWCLDWVGTYPSSATTDPKGPNSGSDRSVRGGSHNCHESLHGGWRSARRGSLAPSSKSSNSIDYIGFRVCLTVD